jgi:hypothetical protein
VASLAEAEFLAPPPHLVTITAMRRLLIAERDERLM